MLRFKHTPTSPPKNPWWFGRLLLSQWQYYFLYTFISSNFLFSGTYTFLSC